MVFFGHLIARECSQEESFPPPTLQGILLKISKYLFSYICTLFHDLLEGVEVVEQGLGQFVEALVSLQRATV